MTAPEEKAVEIEQIARPEVCEASLSSARFITDRLLSELADPESVIYKIMADRGSQMSADAQLGLAPALLIDPTRSGLMAERYRLQAGEMPPDLVGPSIDQLVNLWTVQSKEQVPKLRVPEGLEENVMGVADALQMRGGGPVIFERGETASLEIGPNTILNVVGGARNANRERIKTALAVVESHSDYDRPILATVNPLRKLRPDEREVVASFAPNARNEQELFIASAIGEGFVADPSNMYGSRFLSDGSSYLRMNDQNGTQLIVLAPVLNKDQKGGNATGVFNAYKTLLEHEEEILGTDDQVSSWQFEGSNIVHVTSTHYGPMAIMNNLRAVHELRTTINSFQVIGDNQSVRTAQAHLIEIGLTLDAFGSVIEENPAVRAELLASKS